VISKIVNRDELGAAFGVLSAVQAIAIIAAPGAQYLYSETVSWFPGFVYCMLCTIHLANMGLAAFASLALAKEGLLSAVKEVENDDADAVEDKESQKSLEKND